MDNFRGFSDTLVHLKNINFLVGENSAGKTSLLSLVHILNNKLFSIDANLLSFKEEGPNLGGFEDIISAESRNKKDFTVGYLRPKKNKNTTQYSHLIVTYIRDKDQEIAFNRLSYVDDNKLITVKITDKKIFYKFEDLPTDLSAIDCFRQSTQTHIHSNSGFSQIKTETPPPKKIPFPIIKSIVYAEIHNDNDFDKSFTFSYSHFDEDVIWIAPIREKPQTIYRNIKLQFSPEGTHTPYLLNDILNKDGGTDLKKILDNFGKESGLFQKISSKRFGNSESSPFEINVTLSREPLKITNVGYGVAQILPVIVETFIRKKNSTFCIQQPEVHLHPRAQAALGTFFYDLSHKENKSFLIETHSDFLIDRYRLKQSKGKKSSKAQILYFNRSKGMNIIHTVPIEDDGNYSEDQPDNFRDFFLKEQLDLLSL